MTIGVWIDSSALKHSEILSCVAFAFVANASPEKWNARGERRQSIPVWVCVCVCDQWLAYQESGSIEVSKEAKVRR